MTANEADSDVSASSSEFPDVLKRVINRGRLAKRGNNRRKSCITSRRPRSVSSPETSESNDHKVLPEKPGCLQSPQLSWEKHLAHSGNIVALDCEMVATRSGSALAQCSILSYKGEVLFHNYIRPVDLIVDYRTRWSGILPLHMKSAMPHQLAVNQIKKILEDKICVGHDLCHDFSVLGISFMRSHVRDTAHFKPLRTLAGLVSNQNPSLRNLARHLLKREIQTGCHNSLEDARAALDLYQKHEKLWETYIVEHGRDRAVWLQDQYWPQEIATQC